MMQTKILIPEFLLPLADVFARWGQPVYLVGGCVRNRLLGLPASDLDACGPALPQSVADRLGAAGFTVIPRAMDFGTVEIHLPSPQGRQIVEYTTLRQDSYRPGGGHRPDRVTFTESLEQDARRRDFTLNAIYAHMGTGELLDPLGGLEHLRQGRLVAADRPEIIFSQDGLRLMRAVRFASQLGMDIDPDSWQALVDYRDNLADVKAERVQVEFSKILLSDDAYPMRGGERGPLKGLHLLIAGGLMGHILPELLEGKGMDQRPDYHAYDVLEHQLRTCAAMPPVLPLRLAGLVHDLGKPACRRESGCYLDHMRVGEALARSRLGQGGLRYDRVTVDRVARLIRNHMYDISGTAKDSTLRRFFLRLGLANSWDLVLLREGDITGSGIRRGEARRWRRILGEMIAQQVPFNRGQLAVTGRELLGRLGLSPGPEVGALLEKLYLHCANHPQDNRPERLLRLARGYLPKTDKKESTT